MTATTRSTECNAPGATLMLVFKTWNDEVDPGVHDGPRAAAAPTDDDRRGPLGKVKEIQIAIPEGSVGRRAALIHVSTRSVNGRCGRSVRIPSTLEADW